VRTVVAIDEAAGSLTFAGDVPAGQAAQFMKADVERLVNGATHAALMANESGPPAAPECLVVAISSAGGAACWAATPRRSLRRWPRGSAASGSGISGMYGYGELAPGADGECELHNQTMSLLVVSEAVAPVARPATAAAPRRLAAEPAAAPPPEPPPSRPAVPVPPRAAATGAAGRADQIRRCSRRRRSPLRALRAPRPDSPEPARGPIIRIPRTGIADVAIEESRSSTTFACSGSGARSPSRSRARSRRVCCAAA